MTEAALDRSRVLKSGELFAVFDRHGDISPEVEGAQGLFLGDTRHLSQLTLLVDGERPVLLSSTVQDDNAVMTADLSTRAERELDGSHPEPAHLLREKLLLEDACFERIQIRNYGQDHRTIHLELVFAADYADIFEVRGAQRPRRGEHRDVRAEDGVLTFRYLGLDGCERATEIHVSTAPSSIDGGRIGYRIALGPHEAWSIEIRIECKELECKEREEVAAPGPTVGYEEALARLTEAMHAERARWATLETSNGLFDSWLARSFEDLSMLITETETGPYPYAGTPWFSTVFGRDGIITALECLWLAPHIARGVLEALMRTQATAFDPTSDAEPGKILHEARRGEMARLGEVPFGRYYGTIDATPLFVYLAGQYVTRAGDFAFAKRVWPSVEAAIAWIEQHGDRDGDGYLEYGTRAQHGLRNQGWKDSDDCISHADGRLAVPPIAMCEVQAYVYGAYREAAGLAQLLGDSERASDLAQRADALRARFERDFWDEALGTVCLALDGDKKPCRVRSSNAGHCLAFGIISSERAARVRDALMAPTSFSGWGIRTLAGNERRFSPFSYHNGSVWPHDNALIASGLSRYGMQAEACVVLEALFDATRSYELHRLPELFCGFERRAAGGPTRYPAACRPQAWAAGAVYMLLAAVLGIHIDGRRGRIDLHNPVLPPSVDELSIRGLVIGGGTIDMVLRRHRHDVGVEVTRREGSITVSIVK